MTQGDAAVRVFVAVGSNVQPERHLATAMREMTRTWPDVRFSSAYQNTAVGFDGPDFINLVAGFTTALPLAQVIARLHDIEAQCHRPRSAPKWAPRSLDLDVLLYGDLLAETPAYRLPRPDLVKRAYMLGPMAELAPEVRHPTLGLTIGELWQQFDRGAHPMRRVELAAAAND